MFLGLGIWEVAEIAPVVSFRLLFEGTSLKIPIKTIIALAWMSSLLMSAHLMSYLLFVSIVKVAQWPGRSTDRAKCHSVKNCINSD